VKIPSIGRLTAVLALVSVSVLALSGSSQGSALQTEPRVPRRVLIVAIPRLTWQQVADQRPPNIARLMAQSAVGDLSLRTIGPRTSLGEGYVTIGAGNRAGVRDSDAGRMLERTEGYENGTAAQSFARRTGWDPVGRLLQLSIPTINAMNDRYLYGAEPGALGDALAGAHHTAAVIGNGDVELTSASQVAFDPSSPTDEPSDGPNNSDAQLGVPQVTASIEPVAGENRPAGLALMNGRGEVPAGSVSHKLLERVPTAPFGVAMSTAEVRTEFDKIWKRDTVALVELSDLERADLYRGRASSSQSRVLSQKALARVDRQVGVLLERTNANDLVILVSPAAPRSAETLTPIAVRGRAFRSGTLSSGTTRRGGYVTLPDIAPTVLEQLRIPKPESMTGSAMQANNNGNVSPGRYLHFLNLNKATTFRDRVVTSITITFVILQVVLSLLALAALVWGASGVRRVAATVGLIIMCTPVVTFAMGMTSTYRIGFFPYLLAIYVGAALVAFASTRIGRLVDARRRPVLTAVIPVAATYVLLAVDITSGGRLQLNTIFGYSPQVAGRFAGFGNPAYSLLAMGTVVMSCALWALFDGDRPGSRRRRLVAAVIALFTLTIVLDGHPSFGSDVGGVLSIIPTAFVVLWLLLGRRIRVRLVLIAGAVTLAVIAGFAAIDLARPEDKQTHLGRLVRTTFGHDGGGGLSTVLERKINSNLTVLTNSIWTLTIPLALAVLVCLAWSRPKVLKAHLPDTTANRATLWGGICMCVLGMAVNDSGIAIPAVMFMVLLPYVLYQALSPTDPTQVEPPAPGVSPPPVGGDGTDPADPVPDDENAPHPDLVSAS